jgi:tetratricopeptide (TPR) repeat protein
MADDDKKIESAHDAESDMKLATEKPQDTDLELPSIDAALASIIADMSLMEIAPGEESGEGDAPGAELGVGETQGAGSGENETPGAASGEGEPPETGSGKVEVQETGSAESDTEVSLNDETLNEPAEIRAHETSSIDEISLDEPTSDNDGLSIVQTDNEEVPTRDLAQRFADEAEPAVDLDQGSSDFSGLESAADFNPEPLPEDSSQEASDIVTQLNQRRSAAVAEEVSKLHQPSASTKKTLASTFSSLKAIKKPELLPDSDSDASTAEAAGSAQPAEHSPAALSDSVQEGHTDGQATSVSLKPSKSPKLTSVRTIRADAANQSPMRVFERIPGRVKTAAAVSFLVCVCLYAIHVKQESMLQSKTASAIEAGKYDDAEKAAQEGCLRYPGDPEFHYFYAEVLAHKKLTQRALAEAQVAASARTDDLRFVALHAELLNKSNQFAEALSDYNRLMMDPLWKNRASVIAGRAKANLAVHQAGRVGATVLAASDRALRQLGLSDEEVQHLPAAIRNDIAAARYQKALKELGGLSESERNNTGVVAVRAICHDQLGNFADEYADYSVVITHQPRRRELYLKRAKAAARERKYALAGADIEHAVALNPKVPDAYVLRGDLSLEQNHYKDALVDYKHAVKLAPADQSIREKLGAVKAKLAATINPIVLPTAWTLPKDLLKNDPLTAAYQLMMHGQTDAAVPVLIALIRREPNNIQARRYLAWCLSDLQSARAAIDQFKALEKLGCLNAVDLEKYAFSLEQIDTPLAPEMYMRAIRANPRNGDLLEGLCRVYRDLKEYNKCVATARQGLRVASNDSQTKTFQDMITYSQQKISDGIGE